MAISKRKSKGSIKAFGMENTSFLKSNIAQKILLNALSKYLRWCLSHFGLMSSTYVWLNANSVDFIHSCFCPFLGRQILSALRYANTRKYKIIPSHPPPSVMLSFKKWECTYSPNVHGMKVWWQYNDVLRHLQDVHDHPQGPNVTRLVVLLGAKNLRGCGKKMLSSMVLILFATPLS